MANIKHTQNGSSLIEGLISLFLFSFASIGLSMFQAQILQHDKHAQLRAQAAYLAEEILGLATADAANAGCYTVGTVPTACADTVAQAEATEWAARVSATFPGTAAMPPAVSYAADGTFTVTLRWQRDSEVTAHNYVAIANIQAAP